ncbi:hypothetical protein GCM10027080_32520 [Pedococcus soli]
MCWYQFPTLRGPVPHQARIVADLRKYSVVERERGYLLARLPEGVTVTKDIVDRYLTGTRLRLREVREDDIVVTRKL